jgi:hyaluronoglucosaminidase
MRFLLRLASSLAILLVLANAGCSDRGAGQGDAPFAFRGVIEGFYGQPYDFSSRARVIRFIGARGMNAYVYAPKNDPLDRDEWRTPYPEAQLEEFAELARIGAASGVRFYFGIAPGITYDQNDPADFDRLAAKLRSVHERGVTGFALLFDDLLDPASTALDPQLQAGLIARVAALVAGFGGDTSLWFISHVYTGLADDLRADRGLFAALSPLPPQVYYDAYAALVPPELPIMWTGPGVFSARLTRQDAQAFRDFAGGRPLVVWDNFPVNDSIAHELFLGPYLGRAADLHQAVDGVVLNLMTQPAAGLIAVATAARYFADPASYDPEQAWSDAIADVGGRGASALRLFAEQHRGHPVLAGATEAEELGRRISAAFDGDEPDAIAALRNYLEALAANQAQLAATIDDQQLLAEIAPWSDKLTLLARAGLAGLDALGETASPDAYRAARDAAQAPPWLVAATVSNSGLAALAGGAINPPVDRFADLFAALDARLTAAERSRD